MTWSVQLLMCAIFSQQLWHWYNCGVSDAQSQRNGIKQTLTHTQQARLFAPLLRDPHPLHRSVQCRHQKPPSFAADFALQPFQHGVVAAGCATTRCCGTGQAAPTRGPRHLWPPCLTYTPTAPPAGRLRRQLATHSEPDHAAHSAQPEGQAVAGSPQGDEARPQSRLGELGQAPRATSDTASQGPARARYAAAAGAAAG